jgi:hypothetical protein
MHRTVALNPIAADEEERRALFDEARTEIERELQEHAQAPRALALIREVSNMRPQLSRDLVQQALWSLIEAGRVLVDAKFEVRLNP